MKTNHFHYPMLVDFTELYIKIMPINTLPEEQELLSGGVSVLRCLTRSPELNPIEHVYMDLIWRGLCIFRLASCRN